MNPTAPGVQTKVLLRNVVKNQQYRYDIRQKVAYRTVYSDWTLGSRRQRDNSWWMLRVEEEGCRGKRHGIRPSH